MGQTSQGYSCVVAMPERTPNVKVEEAESYYQAIVDQLATHKDVTVIERKELKLVLNELDLSAALGNDNAGQLYAKAAKNLQAKDVLIPSLCKVNDDFLLSLRMISVKNGATTVSSTRRIRVVAKFKDQAAVQVEQLFSPQTSPALPPDQPDVPAIKEVRQACLDAKADKFFPALWQRAEKLREALKEGQDSAGTVNYYVTLLHLAPRAANPPAGMVFIPGGYVTVNTSAGKRQLWVEPFFMDRCEVSVAEYAKFLEQTISGADKNRLRGLTPITQNVEGFSSPELPVSGVSWNVADMFAKHRGRQLPTMPQWLRAAYGDSDREYPCGDVAACVKANLGDKKGLTCLAPADKPGVDESPFGVLGMTGNVREWTASWYAKDAYAKCPAETPEEPASGTMKLVKGGSFRTGPEKASRSAPGDQCKCGEAFEDVGFRCAMPFFLNAEEIEKAAQSGK